MQALPGVQGHRLCCYRAAQLLRSGSFGGGGNPIFPIFPIPISEKSTFISGKSGNSFSPISPSLITLGHMLIHNFYINVLIALILVYRNSM